MRTDADRILEHLGSVAAERAARSADPAFGRRVDAIKRYQHARFERTYADLLASPRYAPATRFFLDELYGPRDFSERDAQFARIVPALARVFPTQLLQTVRELAELHALSEALDSRMAHALEGGAVGAQSYAAAWRRVGAAAEREQQVASMLAVGRALDRHTHKPMLFNALRLMRGPAHAAGLGGLQEFLENGFAAFRAIGGADEFLETIARREREHIAALFAV